MPSILLTAKSNKSSFLILSTEKPSKMFHSHNGFATVSESIALNLWISILLINK